METAERMKGKRRLIVLINWSDLLESGFILFLFIVLVALIQAYILANADWSVADKHPWL